MTGSIPPRCPAEPNFGIASSRHEREAALRLVYHSYLRAGLVEPNPFQLRILSHHLLVTTDIFVASLDGVVYGTVTLIGDSESGLPMESIYAEEISRIRQQKRLGEVSSLAGSLPNCLELFRWMVQTAKYRGMDGLAVAVHPKHVRFYQRYLAFECIGGQASYPTVCNQPAVALFLDFDLIDAGRPKNYEKFFGVPLPAEKLRPQRMTREEIVHLEQILQSTSNPQPSDSVLAAFASLQLGERFTWHPGPSYLT